MKSIKSATFDGIVDAIEVDVEGSFTKGLPSFSIGGLVTTAIQESRDRVKSALLTNDYKFPPKKVIVNLSPSDIHKTGSHFDLSVALLIALYEEKVDFKGFYIFGELGLDGELKDTKSIFPLILSLANQVKNLKVIVPISSAQKVAMIPNVKVYALKNLSESMEFFKFQNYEAKRVQNRTLEYKHFTFDKRSYFYLDKYPLDFKDVKGQKLAKYAALISASGNHNVLYEGSPGCGKSMIIKRLQYIMPPMDMEAILEKAKLDSLEAKEPTFEPRRVFRNPHHSSTRASIFGGGSVNSKIGEVALANNGILFFDELPHFSKAILEALREPLEDHSILISRVNSKVNYSTKFLFATALNPCPCGNLLSATRECRCSQMEVKRYKNKLSDPLLDRIDMFITMNDSSFDDKSDVDSASMHELVLKTFKMQLQRGQSCLNGKLNDDEIEKFCVLDSPSNDVLNQAVVNFSLSFRSINKVLKVSRTIADLDGSLNIQKKHLLKALNYRKR